MELWFTERHTPNVKFSIKVDRQLYSGFSEFQRIDIFDSKEFGRFLTLDGRRRAVSNITARLFEERSIISLLSSIKIAATILSFKLKAPVSFFRLVFVS